MADIRDLPLFVIAVAESFMINWLIAALFGMIAFTAVNIDALIQVKKQNKVIQSMSLYQLKKHSNIYQ